MLKQITPLRLQVQALGALMRENNDEKIREWLLMHWEIDFSSLAPELQARAIEKVFSLLEPEDRHHYILHFYQCDPMPPYSATNYSQYSTEAKQKIIEYLFQIDVEYQFPFIQFLISGYRHRPELKMLIETSPMVVDGGSGTKLPILLAMARVPAFISYIAEVYFLKDETLSTQVMTVHNQESFLAYLCLHDSRISRDILHACFRKAEFTTLDTINSGVNIGGEIVFSVALDVTRKNYEIYAGESAYEKLLHVNLSTLNQSPDKTEFGMFEGGISPLYWLAICSVGRQLLRNNADLRALITPAGLNQAVAGDRPDKGASPLYWLARDVDGRELLCNNADLRAMITQKGLNQPVTGDGPHQGKSPLYWLAVRPDGIELLLNDDDLRTMITEKGLNQPLTGDWDDKGMSPLYWLAASPEGRELLRNNADLRALITPEGLNQPVTGDGDDKGKSPLYWLAENPEGRELLRNNADLRALITPEGLNQPVTGDGDDKGKSPLYWLAENPEGRELLRNNDDLRTMITEKGLNQPLTGDGPNKGESPLYWLTTCQEGIQILKKTPNLMNMITLKALNTKTDSSGESPADNLQKTDEGKELLNEIMRAKRRAPGILDHKRKKSRDSEEMEMSEMDENDKRCMPPT